MFIIPLNLFSTRARGDISLNIDIDGMMNRVPEGGNPCNRVATANGIIATSPPVALAAFSLAPPVGGAGGKAYSSIFYDSCCPFRRLKPPVTKSLVHSGL